MLSLTRSWPRAGGVPQREQPDIDPTGPEARFAIAEVVLPEPAERDPEPEGLDARPCIDEPLAPFHQRGGVAFSERHRPLDRQPRTLRLRLQRAPRRQHPPREDEALDEVRACAIAI